MFHYVSFVPMHIFLMVVKWIKTGLTRRVLKADNRENECNVVREAVGEPDWLIANARVGWTKGGLWCLLCLWGRYPPHPTWANGVAASRRLCQTSMVVHLPPLPIDCSRYHKLWQDYPSHEEGQASWSWSTRRKHHSHIDDNDEAWQIDFLPPTKCWTAPLSLPLSPMPLSTQQPSWTETKSSRPSDRKASHTRDNQGTRRQAPSRPVEHCLWVHW